jgi:hypothetical protein
MENARIWWYADIGPLAKITFLLSLQGLLGTVRVAICTQSPPLKLPMRIDHFRMMISGPILKDS